jgi:hypothetical protein
MRRALDMNVAAPVGFQVGSVDLELFCRRLHHNAARLPCRDHHRVADPMGAPRGERSHAMRPGIGIRGIDVDIIDGHTERLGADLARDRLHALAEVDR